MSVTAAECSCHSSCIISPEPNDFNVIARKSSVCRTIPLLIKVVYRRLVADCCLLCPGDMIRPTCGSCRLRRTSCAYSKRRAKPGRLPLRVKVIMANADPSCSCCPQALLDEVCPRTETLPSLPLAFRALKILTNFPLSA